MAAQKDYLWILGAPDPEMEHVAKVLHAAGQMKVVLAQHLDRSTSRTHRANASNAYRLAMMPPPGMLDEADGAVLVECGGPVEAPLRAWFGDAMVWRIDHHREGDPGYGKPPAEFFEASSVGQVLAHLFRWCAMEPRTDYLAAHPGLAGLVAEARMVAAADHCLRAAYSNLCPGVDPDVLAAWRVRSRAAHQGIEPAELSRRMAAALGHLMDPAHPRLVMDGETVVDLRAAGTRPEMPEVGARNGVAFLVEMDGMPGWRKVVLQASDGRAVGAFLGGWAAGQGYVEPYGDQARGFAGARRQLATWRRAG